MLRSSPSRPPQLHPLRNNNIQGGHYNDHHHHRHYHHYHNRRIDLAKFFILVCVGATGIVGVVLPSLWYRLVMVGPDGYYYWSSLVRVEGPYSPTSSSTNRRRSFWLLTRDTDKMDDHMGPIIIVNHDSSSVETTEQSYSSKDVTLLTDDDDDDDVVRGGGGGGNGGHPIFSFLDPSTTTTSANNKRNNSTNSTMDNNSTDDGVIIPYYLVGKTHYKEHIFHAKKTYHLIQQEVANVINPSIDNVWVLQDPINTPTRNHEAIIVEYYDDNNNNNNNNDDEEEEEQQQQQILLVNILGRYSRVVQWLDLKSGRQSSVETDGADPDGRPLNDLNHVASVVVDSIISSSSDDSENNGSVLLSRPPRKKEIWLPCGFHNDEVGMEQSSTHVRVIDLHTGIVRAGPKLPYSGGACGAAGIPSRPGEPDMVCAFGGTDGNHDTGTFLPYVSCYDRVRDKWVYPFGKLPFGMDHLNIVVIPRGACISSDPARVLVFNFRTGSYNTTPLAQIWAHDIPYEGWTDDELDGKMSETPGMWYIFDNRTYDGVEDEANAPRDASGVVMANGGRSVINIGGINQVRYGPNITSRWYSTIRELDVCTKQWTKVADMGIRTFAHMAAASTKLNMAFFCGGARYLEDNNGNTDCCLGIRLPGITFWNHRTTTAAVQKFY